MKQNAESARILAFLRHRTTNALTESLNAKSPITSRTEVMTSTDHEGRVGGHSMLFARSRGLVTCDQPLQPKRMASEIRRRDRARSE